MIGLVRRPERRNRMIACLEELDFNYTLFDAVDGRWAWHLCGRSLNIKITCKQSMQAAFTKYSGASE